MHHGNIELGDPIRARPTFQSGIRRFALLRSWRHLTVHDRGRHIGFDELGCSARRLSPSREHLPIVNQFTVEFDARILRIQFGVDGGKVFVLLLLNHLLTTIAAQHNFVIGRRSIGRVLEPDGTERVGWRKVNLTSRRSLDVPAIQGRALDSR